MREKIDFGTLKQTVLLSAVLERYGIKTRQANTTYLRADCPLPSHTSKESKGSFAVNTEKNIWCCKSTSCNEAARKKGGDVLDFVSLMEQTNVLGAAKKLLEWFPDKKITPPSLVEPGGAKEVSAKSPQSKDVQHPNGNHSTTNKPLNFELKGIAYHPYLKERGISEELALKFGVGFFPGKGSMSGRVVIPIRDGAGQLVAYAGRTISNDEPRYKLPLGFQKSLVLYNLHNVKGDALTIVEGYFSAMKVTAAGFPCVGLMGSTLTEAQEKLLRFKFITLLLDPDPAGAAGVADMLPRLARCHYVRVARNEKPPDEMTEEEIKNTLRYVCPIL
jgi:DNA primase